MLGELTVVLVDVHILALLMTTAKCWSIKIAPLVSGAWASAPRAPPLAQGRDGRQLLPRGL